MKAKLTQNKAIKNAITPYSDVDTVLNELLSRIQHALQDKLLGLYLYGSLTAGDFDHEISDIDLLAVTSSKLTSTEFESLRRLHKNFAHAHPVWNDRLDVAYIPARALKAFRTAKDVTLISPGEPFHVRKGEALLDWAQNWYIVRRTGKTLFGPPPTTLFPPVTQEEFRACVKRYMVELHGRGRTGQPRKEQGYEILTFCRAIYALETGNQASKKQAALWAQKKFPKWAPLIKNAFAWRQAWREENIDHSATQAETNKFLSFARDRVLASTK